MPQEKIDRFRRLKEADPGNELARYSLGSALLEAAEYAEAEQEFAAALAKKKDWVMAYVLRGRCLIHLQRFDEAREQLQLGRGHSIQQGHEAPVEEIDELLEDLP